MRRGRQQQKWHYARYPHGFRREGAFGPGMPGNRIYRSRNGIIMGVCRGISDYFQVPVAWVRIIFVVTLFFSGLWPVIGIYFAASFLMKPRPVRPLETDGEKDFYDTYVNSRTGAVRTLKNRFDALDRRIRRMEDTVTASEFEWDQRMNS